MSQENLEIVRAMIERFNRNGFLPEELFDPDVDLFNVRESPLPGSYHGYEGLRQWREEVFDVVEEGRFEIDNLQDVDEADLVIYGIRLLGRAKHTRLQIDIAWTNVNWIREGRIYRSKSFTNHEEALEAAGLAERAISQENMELRGLAEAAFEAINSGDLESLVALTTEDCEFTSMVAEAEGTTFRGHDGVRTWWKTVRGAFDAVRWELIDVRASGDRGVAHFRMAGSLGSVPVEQTMWQTVKLRDGKVFWWAFFRTEGEALEAAGLSE